MSKPRQKVGARSASPAQRLDRRKRTDTAALDHHARRDLWEAFRHGIAIGFPLTCTIDFHPALMDQYPAGELAVWFKDELRNRITTWIRRKKIRWYAIWVRENYVGDRREHLHLMIYCPKSHRAELLEAIRRWYPGDPTMVKMGTLTWRKHPSGRIACPGFEYRLKQMTSKAQGKPRLGRPRREVKNRYDDAPVAPVHGPRHGVSRTLARTAREAWLEVRHPQQHALALGAPGDAG